MDRRALSTRNGDGKPRHETLLPMRNLSNRSGPIVEYLAGKGIRVFSLFLGGKGKLRSGVGVREQDTEIPRITLC